MSKVNISTEVINELIEIKNELISCVMRMEKVLRTNECPTMRAEVKRLMELLND